MCRTQGGQPPKSPSGLQRSANRGEPQGSHSIPHCSQETGLQTGRDSSSPATHGPCSSLKPRHAAAAQGVWAKSLSASPVAGDLNGPAALVLDSPIANYVM